MAALLSERPVDICYRHTVNGQTFEFDTEKIRRELAPVPMSHPRVRRWLQSVLNDGFAGLQRQSP
jgi:hypothetical protein